MQAFLNRQWNKRGWWAWLWLPLSLLVCSWAKLRRLAYRSGLVKQQGVAVPVIVVGNLSVGGTGKTPLVAYLAELLRAHGLQPGIIARGYRGRAEHWPQHVTPDSDPVEVGDEPVMLAGLTGCPVMAGPGRVAAAQKLLAETHCDIILSDDGFSHLKLRRDIDILVFDTARDKPLGNGWCLPSGPLREPASAKKAADMLVFNGATTAPGASHCYTLTLKTGKVRSLRDGRVTDLAALAGAPLHALAGIGHPQRFFNTLRKAGLQILEHPFDDHHAYTPQDLEFEDQYDLITTEKDAIKLASINSARQIWVLPVTAELEASFAADLFERLEAPLKKP